MENAPGTGSIVENICEAAFDRFMRRIGARTFQLRHLSTGEYVPLALDKTLAFHPCANDPEFQRHLMEHVGISTPCYLYPTWSNFPTHEAIVFIPGMPLVVLQCATSCTSDLKMSGLSRVQNWLKPDSILEALRPYPIQPLLAVFVVPEPVGAPCLSPQESLDYKRSRTDISTRSLRRFGTTRSGDLSCS